MSRRARMRRPQCTEPSAGVAPRAAAPVAAADRQADQVIRSEAGPRIRPVGMPAGAETQEGRPLGAGLRNFFAARLGEDFAPVRLHDRPRAAAMADALGARAFTVGRDIYFADGERSEATQAGRQLIAHELVHVAQQARHGQAIQRAPAPAPPVSGLMLKIQRVILTMCMNARMQAAFDMIARDGIRIVCFRTGYDTWQYDDGRIEEVAIPGLQGTTDVAGKTIRLNEALSAEQMAETLFHELQHWGHFQDPAGPRGLESEIQARIATEQLAIERGRPPTGPKYRTADGRVNEAEIRASMASSSHYSPTGRQRIGRRYDGETPIPGPLVCPPIGDFPEPSRERMIA
jgi:hypothetical protein